MDTTLTGPGLIRLFDNMMFVYIRHISNCLIILAAECATPPSEDKKPLPGNNPRCETLTPLVDLLLAVAARGPSHWLVMDGSGSGNIYMQITPSVSWSLAHGLHERQILARVCVSTSDRMQKQMRTHAHGRGNEMMYESS